MAPYGGKIRRILKNCDGSDDSCLRVERQRENMHRLAGNAKKLGVSPSFLNRLDDRRWRESEVFGQRGVDRQGLAFQVVNGFRPGAILKSIHMGLQVFVRTTPEQNLSGALFYLGERESSLLDVVAQSADFDSCLYASENQGNDGHTSNDPAV